VLRVLGRFFSVPEIERDRDYQVLARREYMLCSDELAHGTIAACDELTHDGFVAAGFQDDEAQVQVAVLTAVLVGFVEEADVDLTGLEDNHVISLHLACALRVEVAAHAVLIKVQARLADVYDAEVLAEVVEGHPEDALVPTTAGLVVEVIVGLEGRGRLVAGFQRAGLFLQAKQFSQFRCPL